MALIIICRKIKARKRNTAIELELLSHSLRNKIEHESDFKFKSYLFSTFWRSEAFYLYYVFRTITAADVYALEIKVSV